MKVLLSWSGGKDSCLALAELLNGFGRLELAGLATTLSDRYRRISSHGVREELVEEQARSLGLELFKIEIATPPAAGDSSGPLPPPTPNALYESCLLAALERARAAGVGGVAFGDIFLEDLRAYREALLDRVGLRAYFPLWGRPTAGLLRDFVGRGFRAVTVATDPDRLGPEWTGRALDEAFLDALPDGVDPCGERGEYHTFVFDGPPFRWPVRWSPGSRVDHAPYHFQDLLPA